jgi:hypothetical protein
LRLETQYIPVDVSRRNLLIYICFVFPLVWYYHENDGEGDGVNATRDAECVVESQAVGRDVRKGTEE